MDNKFLWLVSKGNPMPEGYEPVLETVSGDKQMEKTAAYMMRQMLEAAAEDGIDLKVLSAYRSPEYQENLFQRNIERRMANGMTYDEAYADTAANVAKAGESEHNLGLAADLVTHTDYDVYEGFENTPQFEWLKNNAADYGFILRYPKGKTDITGYVYEPWHYRYVGPCSAKKIKNLDLTLEEYLAGNPVH